MSKKQLYIQTAIVILMVVIAAFSRLIPHTFNLTPVGAIALFGGAYLGRNWLSFFIPLAAIYASDLILNNVVYATPGAGFAFFYEGWYWVYGSYALIVLFGAYLLKKVTVLRVLGGVVGSTVIFYLVSNFGCWPGTVAPVYSNDMNGLIACYVAGLPFVKATFMGDLIFSTSLFGTFALLKSNVLQTSGELQKVFK